MDNPIEKPRPNVEASQECPVCHLLNLRTAKFCDCGFSFETHLGGRKSIGNLRKRHIVMPIVLGVFTPSLVIFSLEVFVGARPVPAIPHRQLAEGAGLFLDTVFGLIPFLFLIVSTAEFSRTLKGKRLDCVFIGGLVGILAFMIPGHLSVWYPLYSGGHTNSNG